MPDLREKLKGKNCFKPFVIPEWNTDGAEYTLRGVSPDEFSYLETISDESNVDDITRGAKMFSVLFGDSAGNRVYDDSDGDIAAIKKNIPILVIGRVVMAGMEFSNDSIKKN